MWICGFENMYCNAVSLHLAWIYLQNEKILIDRIEFNWSNLIDPLTNIS